ncbi:MAG: hypothetical protein MZV70_61150 [Desulfobacterales bacterium]|nr:hypothetical protein [Desulfobacterales bacterium]
MPVIRSGFRCPLPIPLTSVLTSPNSGQFPILSPGHRKSLLPKVLRASPLGRSLKGFLYTTTTATNPPAKGQPMPEGQKSAEEGGQPHQKGHGQ